VTKENLSSVDTWTRPAESELRSEALRRSANKPLNEPYAIWERREKIVFVSDIKGMSLEDLDVLASDMQVKWNELNSEITTAYARLASVPETQPSVADRLRLTIRRMVRKKTHAKTIGWEASRQKSYLNKEKHRPKPKLVNSQRDKDSLTALDSKMNYFRIKKLMSLIRAEIGDARFDVLESQARAQAIPLFQAWVTTTDTPPVLIEHVLLENQKHMLPTP
jgi:hypothetical protein